MADNDEACGSLRKSYWEMSQEMEEQPHRRYEGIGDDSTDPEYTTASSVGDDTTDDGATEDATTDGGSQSKRQRKDRRPNVLGTVKEELLKCLKMGFQRRPQN